MDALLHGMRVTIRALRRAPTFTAAAILTIALGVGVSTAMFSVAHAVQYAPLPYPAADRLTYVGIARVDDGVRRPLSGPEFAALARESSLHEDMAAVWPTAGTLVEDGRPVAVRVAVVSTNFHSLLGVPAIRGRWFAKTDGGVGGEPAIVISGGLWQSRFGGADVIGRSVRLDGGWGFGGGRFRIIGVMPPDFTMLLPIDASVPASVDVWIAFPQDLASGPRNTYFLRVVGRMAAGAAPAGAKAEVVRVGAELMKQHPYPPGRQFFAVPLYDDLVKGARVPLLILQGAVLLVLLVLLIASANVANLMLARGWAQRKEMAIQFALGAPGRRVVMLPFLESVAIAGAGGLLGVALAYATLRLLPLLGQDTLPRAYAAALSLPVLGFALAATLGSGLLFGCVAFFQLKDLDTGSVLKAEGPGAGSGPQRRWRSALVVAELALSTVLLIGAGLLTRTFLNLRAVDPGYRWDDVLTLRVVLPGERYGDAAVLSRFTRAIERGLQTVPGVEAAGAVNQLPLDDTPNWSTPYKARGAGTAEESALADARLVTPGYFETLRATLAQGRWINDQDDETQPLALMVDERLARRAWPDRTPIGEELSIRVWSEGGFGERWGRVVGVVRHIRHHDPAADVREQAFVPFAQAPRNQMSVVVRSRVARAALVRDLTRRITDIDPELAVSDARPLADYVAGKQATARFTTALAVLFAVLSLLLACVGIYGIISYSVAERTSEVAVRFVLGARTADVMRLVMGHGATLTAAGLALGLAASVGAVRWVEILLYEVTTFDSITFGAAPACLAVTALLACYLPARQATLVAPAEVLRNQ
jgi:putative ABC transport system permease protein